MTLDQNIATIKTIPDLLTWSNNITAGLLGYAVVVAIGIITYTTLVTYTRDDYSSLMASLFVTLFTSFSWAYILSQSSLFVLSIASGVGMIALYLLGRR